MTSASANLSKYAIYSLLLISSLSFSSLYADPTPKKALHNHQNIVNTARQFLDENIDSSQYSSTQIQMSHLDPRLRLTRCDRPLTSSLAPGSQLAGKTTVHIRCNSSSPWTVYISADVMLFGKVIQTSGPLIKGHILRKNDLILVEEDLGKLRYGYFTDKKYLTGKQLKRRLPQNRVIKANYVKAATLIKRGEIVSIIAKNTGYSVKMNGKALADGARGDHIRVKNTSSKRIVEGIVMEAGVVSIN